MSLSVPRRRLLNVTHALPPLASAFLGQLTGKRPSTVKTYEGGLRIFSRWCDAEGLDLVRCTSNDVSRYLHTLASEGRSASTVPAMERLFESSMDGS